MSDEQNPIEAPEVYPRLVVIPPVQRVLGGWIASGIMLFLAITAAVYGYLNGFSDEPSFEGLQEVFERQVSVGHGLPDALDDTAEQGVRDVLDDALEDSGEHEEAARVAVVAAHELGEEPDETALETLRNSEDQTSRDIAKLYSSETVDEGFVDEFTAEESDEFAVRLAQAHAREMAGEDGERDTFLDKTLLVKTTAIMGGVALGGAGGVVCLILFFTARSAGRLKPVGFASTTKLDGDRLMIRFALYMLGFAVIGIGVGFLRQESSLIGQENMLSPVWAGTAAMLATAVFVVAMLYFPLLGKADGLRGIIGGKAEEFWKNVQIGLYGYLCTIPVLIIVLAAVFLLGDLIPQPSHPISKEMASATPYDWIAIALTASILAPFIEELTFRGLLFPALASQIKRPLWAILACGFLFAAIHPQGPMIWPALMTTGGVAAYVRYYTGSLVPSFVLHFVHNSVIVVTALLVS